MTVAQERSETALARDAIGLPGVVFQAIAAMGLGATIVSSLPVTMSYAGGAAVVPALICLLALLTVALSISALAKHLPAAGSYFTYSSNAMHPVAGFLVGWLYILLTILVEPLLVLILAATIATTSPFSGAPDLWWVYALIALVFIWALGYFGIVIGSRANTILAVFEIVVFLVLSIWLVVAAGSANTLNVFTLQHANNPDYPGMSGVIAAMVFTVLAFSGFEGAAPLAEETRDPKRNIGRGIILSLFVVAGVEILSIYAATVFYGPDKMTEFAKIGGGLGANWEQLASQVWGTAGVALVVLAIVNSCLANANGGAIAATRTLFSMGRIHLLPTTLAAVQPKWKSPHMAVHLQFVIGTVITLGLGFWFGTFNGFGIVGTAIGILVALLYMTINVSCFLYYLRKRRDEFGVIRHAVVPLVGVVILVPVFCAGAGIKILDFISPLAAPFSYGAIVVGLWMLAGIAYDVYLWRANPRRLEDTVLVFNPDATLGAVPVDGLTSVPPAGRAR